MANNYTITEENVGKRLDSFICEVKNDFSRSHIKTMIENGDILLDKVVKSGEKLKLNDNVVVKDVEEKQLDIKAENIDIEIVYEDDDLAVINKPQGLVVHPANGNENGTLVNALLFHLKNLSSINGIVRPGIVHRIDKDTSGLLLVAKNDKAHISLAKQIETKTCHRHYLALCNGNIKEDCGRIETYIGRSKKARKKMAGPTKQDGKLAITDYVVKERFGKYTLVEFVLQTGRTHQIRVHSKYINHSIVGDMVYGNKCEFKLNGQLLHAYKIEFNQPSTNERLEFSCELPEYFEKVLKKLKNGKK